MKVKVEVEIPDGEVCEFTCPFRSNHNDLSMFCRYSNELIHWEWSGYGKIRRWYASKTATCPNPAPKEENK